MVDDKDLVLIGNSAKLSKLEKVIYKNLKALKIRPDRIKLSVVLKDKTYIVYPTNPSREIQGLDVISRGSKGYSGRLGAAEYFPGAFEENNQDYNILILWKNPLGHYLNSLLEGNGITPCRPFPIEI